MKKILLSFIFVTTLLAQNSNFKQELRAAWLTTYFNLDWPNSSDSTSNQRIKLIEILDKYQEVGINACFFQIRPTCDAFYNSPYEPWSSFLTGLSGRAPNPLWDPLTFAVEECHKRGIELHAWMNPYRVKTVNTTMASSHISNVKPSWCVTYNNTVLLNPGLPTVRNYVKDIVKDVVLRYDIDGIHFDDYFYPYPATGQTFNDNTAFANDPRGFTNKDNWRRNNVDIFIKMLDDTIKYYKPHVKFGISPFGIWRNASSSSLGSATNGLESFSALYCDTRKWMIENTIDYVMPQLYWKIGNPAADYNILINWWGNIPTQRHLYSGMISSNLDPSGANWSLSNITTEIRLNRSLSNKVQGVSYFKTSTFTDNYKSFNDTLKNNYYKYKALTPKMPWIDNIPPNAPNNLIVNANGNNLILDWKAPAGEQYGYVIYKSNNNNIDINDPQFIYKIIFDTVSTFNDVNGLPNNGASVKYAITTLDRLKNESSPVNAAFCKVGVSPEIINNNCDLSVTTNSAVSYEWFMNENLIPVGNNSTYFATVSGTYTVELTYSNACKIALPEVNINCGGAVNINELSNLGMLIYPNPITNVLNFKLVNNAIVSKIKITDALGKIMVEKSNLEPISTTNWSKGIYIAYLYFNDKVSTVKVVKE